MSEDMNILLEQLERILRESAEGLAGAELAADAARVRRDLLRVRQEAEDVLARAADGSVSERAPSYRTQGLAGLTLHEAARRVLESAGMPLHVRDLGARIKAGGWRHPRATAAPPDQIEYQLAARLPRRPGTFRKTAPNTFGLLAWPDAPGHRPTPRLAIAKGRGPRLARRIADRPEMVFEDEPRWRSS